jgi:hypothetical protein
MAQALRRIFRPRVVVITIAVFVAIATIVAVALWPRSPKLTDRQFVALLATENLPLTNVSVTSNGPSAPADLLDDTDDEIATVLEAGAERYRQGLDLSGRCANQSLTEPIDQLRGIGSGRMRVVTPDGESTGAVLLLFETTADTHQVGSPLLSCNLRLDQHLRADGSPYYQLTNSTDRGMTVWRVTDPQPAGDQLNFAAAAYGNIVIMLGPRQDWDPMLADLAKLRAVIDQAE